MEDLRLMFDSGGNGKIYGKVMNSVRQRLRRFGPDDVCADTLYGGLLYHR